MCMKVLEQIDFNAFGALEFSFVDKMRCFAYSIDEASIKIALDSTSAKKQQTILFHLQKKFPHLRVECEQIKDFSFFYQKARDYAKFIVLSKNLRSRLAMLIDTPANLSSTPTTHNTEQNSKEIVELLDFILLHALQSHSSDIHIELNANGGIIRNRIDGILVKSFELPQEVFAVLSARLKLECKLDMSENRRSLDGRFSKVFNGEEFDFRFSSMPNIGGESLVIRILTKSAKGLQIHKLGFDLASLHLIKKELYKSSGVILLVGPTGCGKSTTLYAMLDCINDKSKKIITLEDPIEYRIDGLIQVLLNEEYNFSFQKALRGALRQDPDVMMIGEIRDSQTLESALQASLTGHLIFATLHANDTLGALERILALGGRIETLSQNLLLLISQRLARKLCHHCKIEVKKDFYNEYNEQIYASLCANLTLPDTLFRAKGCPYCNNSGFSGRILLSEVLPQSEEFRAFLNGDKHIKIPMISLRQSIERVLSEGLCSVDEIYRVC